MAVQARFYVAEVTQFATGPGWADPAPAGRVTMRPVTRGEENKQWASATPSGEFTMTVRGDAFPFFQDRIGEEVSIIIDAAPQTD